MIKRKKCCKNKREQLTWRWFWPRWWGRGWICDFLRTDLTLPFPHIWECEQITKKKWTTYSSNMTLWAWKFDLSSWKFHLKTTTVRGVIKFLLWTVGAAFQPALHRPEQNLAEQALNIHLRGECVVPSRLAPRLHRMWVAAPSTAWFCCKLTKMVYN